MAAKPTDGAATGGARKSLTEGAILKAAREAKEQGRRIDLADTACRGLVIRLTPAGGKAWVLSVRDHEGKPRRFPLDGSFPGMSIGAAREAARALHGKVKAGFDPISQKREQRGIREDAKVGIGTLRALLDTYEQAFAANAASGGKFIKSWKAQRQSIEHVFAAHLDKATALLTAQDFQRTADAHGAKYSAALAVRCIRPVLKWASKPSRALAPAGVADIEPPATVLRRERILSTDELRALLPVLRASDRPYAAALRFMLLTLSRREETCGARWHDVDWANKTWTIPAERAKNGMIHTVTLSEQALGILRALLPAPDTDGKPITPDPASLIFKTRTGAALGNWDRETKALLVDAGLAKVIQIAEPMQGKMKKTVKQAARASDVVMIDGSDLPTRHDLRRTGATLIGNEGVSPHVIEAALNHVAIHNRLAATYNRSRYRQEVAEALQILDDKLRVIEAGGAKVIQIAEHRA